MDSILKLIVGCLGLVGLIVMVVPNSDPLSSENAEAGAARLGVGAPSNAIAPPPPPPATSAEEQPAPSKFVVDDYAIGNFGQPMVDPTPPAQRTMIAQQQQQQQQQQMQQQESSGLQTGGPAGPLPLPPIPAN